MKTHRLRSWVEKVLFRIAFAVCVLFAIVLWLFVLGGIATLVRPDSRSLEGILLALFFLGLFPLGAFSFLVFHHRTRAEYVLSESDRWLGRRREVRNQRTKWRKVLQRWAVWIPTVTVVAVCLFFDETWTLTSHLLHPGRGKLIGYEVSIPINWTIRYSDLDGNGSDAHSIVVAERYRGLLRAGSGLYLGRRPFSVSAMNFRSTPAGDPLATKPASAVISERTVGFGTGAILCREEVPPRWMTSVRYVNCFTLTGDFSGRFNGNDEEASAFYRTLESVKVTK